MGNSRIYYGEYSLKHWIDLLLKGNIVLPEYQRHFVWDERSLKRLIKSLQEGQFIQPVTIGLYKTAERGLNLLLDGQQRLSSILLACLGFFPEKAKFESSGEEMATEDDSALDREADQTVDPETDEKPIKWTIRELNKLQCKSIDELRSKLVRDQRYKKLDLKLDETFWQTHFIGFSFVVPDMNEEDRIQKYFTHLFRNMNYLGTRLTSAESRKSLYYQNPELANYFEGKDDDGEDVLCGLKVTQDFVPRQIDFIRYLSTLSQKIAGRAIMVGYSAYNSRENFYADYVSFLLDLEQESRIDKFDGFEFRKVFPGNEVGSRYHELKNSIEKIKQNTDLGKNAFKSWIDADLWLFGLIYYVVFNGKKMCLDEDKCCELEYTIDEEIKSKNDAYLKRSNALGNLRERIGKSIEIYGNYVL